MDAMIKNVKLVELNTNIDIDNFKDDLIEYNCLCYNKNYQQKFDEKLKEQYFNIYKSSNHNSSKFIVSENCLSL